MLLLKNKRWLNVVLFLLYLGAFLAALAALGLLLYARVWVPRRIGRILAEAHKVSWIPDQAPFEKRILHYGRPGVSYLIRRLETGEAGLIEVRCLGRSDDARAVLTLILLLDGRLRATESMKATAAEHLGELGDRSAVSALLACVESSTYDMLLWNAISALGKLGDERAVRPLIRVLLNADSLEPRRRVGLALARIGASAVDPLIAELGNDDFSVVYHCACSLAQMDPAPTGRLIAALGSPSQSKRVRRQEGIALALGMIGDEAALVPLVNLIKGADNYRDYPQAWEAVAKITGTDFRYDVRRMEEHVQGRSGRP